MVIAASELRADFLAPTILEIHPNSSSAMGGEKESGVHSRPRSQQYSIQMDN
jgi:hypothetical protein